jgi:hypothetical protein
MNSVHVFFALLAAVGGSVLLVSGSALALAVITWPLAHNSRWRGSTLEEILRASGGPPEPTRPNQTDIFAPLLDHIPNLARVAGVAALVTGGGLAGLSL